MRKVAKAKGGGSASSRRRAMRERAKRRVGELEGMLAGLQAARRESQAGDAARLEERAIDMLRGWRAELDRPGFSAAAAASASPSHHLPNGNNSHGSSDLSSYIRRMLQLNEEEEEEDATSRPAAEAPPVANTNAEPFEAAEVECAAIHGGAPAAFFEGLSEHGFAGVPQDGNNCLEGTYFNPCQLDLQQQVAQNMYFAFGSVEPNGKHTVPLIISDFNAAICTAPSAFLRPKCALWDCPRPARGVEWYQDYCSSFHATLALSEGPPGMTPVLRPGGIDLKDGPLFAALAAKTQGKNVGIPECQGAATTRSPWNAPELFDLSILSGESLREWLFFDKPRRAFDSGNRKQRSLPDYVGRGWHESRKQVMTEFGGLKRSYYMDPQPLTHYEWHLYEYEMNSCDACALYRLELKLVDPKKGAKGKVKSDALVDLQKQMVRLNAKNSADNRRCAKGRANAGLKEPEEQLYWTPDIIDHDDDDRKIYSALIEKAQIDGNPVYGPYGYTIDSLNDLYGT